MSELSKSKIHGGGRAQAGAVKNRAPAPIQIAAEQILREAAERQDTGYGAMPPEPTVMIHDAEEYRAHLRERRKVFEDNIRYRREHIGNWVKYARFEEENGEMERARSVFERALEVEPRSGELWLRYAETEMRQANVNHARNVFDRAVQLLPRIDFLWYKYAFLERMMGDGPKLRAVFERWTSEWCPDDNAWLSYARSELAAGFPAKADEVMQRYANAYPCTRAFCRYAKWAEHEARDPSKARYVYECALAELPPEEVRKARLFRAFAAFEERQGEHERARIIYKHAVDLLELEKYCGEGADATGIIKKDGEERKQQRQDDNEYEVTDWEREKRRELYKAYVTFEKKHGDRESIESLVVSKQRAEYKKMLEADPLDYDTWFEYAAMEEEYVGEDRPEVVREVYERAISNLPPSKEKAHWKRYIYLWIYYALFEELTVKDLDRASEVYRTCLTVIPHKDFTFGKIWINAAKLHVRRMDLPAARKLLGTALGLTGGKKTKIYREYVALELALGEIDRCRTLYSNWLKAAPHRSQTWVAYATLEVGCGEVERARAIYELAVEQPELDGPEHLWKAYVDLEVDEGSHDRARELYRRLLERTDGHVKVWISLARFEASVGNPALPDKDNDNDDGKTTTTTTNNSVEAARKVYRDAYDRLRAARRALDDHMDDDAATTASSFTTATANSSANQNSEDRVLLLDAWRAFEKSLPSGVGDVESVERRMPRRVKRRRARTNANGTPGAGWEEYFDYHFPDDDDRRGNSEGKGGAGGNLKILEMAARWKKLQRDQVEDDDDDDDDDRSEDDDEDDNDAMDS